MSILHHDPNRKAQPHKVSEGRRMRLSADAAAKSHTTSNARDAQPVAIQRLPSDAVFFNAKVNQKQKTIGERRPSEGELLELAE